MGKKVVYFINTDRDFADADISGMMTRHERTYALEKAHKLVRWWCPF